MQLQQLMLLCTGTMASRVEWCSSSSDRVALMIRNSLFVLCVRRCRSGWKELHWMVHGCIPVCICMLPAPTPTPSHHHQQQWGRESGGKTNSFIKCFVSVEVLHWKQKLCSGFLLYLIREILCGKGIAYTMARGGGGGRVYVRSKKWIIKW